MTITTSGHYALAWTTSLVSAIVVLTRTYVRFKIRSIGTDDYLMLMAGIWFICFASLGTAIYSAGAAFTGPNGASNLSMNTMATVVSSLSLIFGRTSVGFLLLRIVGHTRPARWQRWFIIATIVCFQILSFLELTGAFFPLCEKVPPVRNPGCLPASVSLGFVSAWNFFGVFMDISFSTLPLSLIYKLNMSRRRKAALGILLGLGWIAAIFILLRAVAPFTSWDAKTASTITLVCSYMEQTVVIICGSLATLMPLYRYWTVGTLMRPQYPPQGPDYRDDLKQPMEPKSLTTADGSHSSQQNLRSGSLPGIHVQRDFGVTSS